MPQRSTKYYPGEEFYRPLGELMMHFNYLELRMRWAIVVLVGHRYTNRTEMMVGHIRSFDSEIDLFSQLAMLRFKDIRTKAQIKRLVKRMRDVNDYRNDLIHGKWHALGSPAYVSRFQSRARTPKWRHLRPTPQSVHGNAAKTLRIANAIFRFTPKIIELNARALRASSRKNS